MLLGIFIPRHVTVLPRRIPAKPVAFSKTASYHKCIFTQVGNVSRPGSNLTFCNLSGHKAVGLSQNLLHANCKTAAGLSDSSDCGKEHTGTRDRRLAAL